MIYDQSPPPVFLSFLLPSLPSLPPFVPSALQVKDDGDRSAEPRTPPVYHPDAASLGGAAVAFARVCLFAVA